MKPTLLILAAGMGSRYGGLKQVEPVGPYGETIIDYSIYDAVKAGFGRVVFVIRKSFAKEFIEKFDPKLKGKIPVDYVYQELDDLPHDFELPPNREKPWGTAHAILVAKDVIDEPFCQLNADDFYGFDAFKAMAGFLTTSDDPAEYSMVGYRLINTLSDYGHVSRGICEVDDDDLLRKIVETTKILKRDDKIISVEPDGSENQLTGDENVSMNMWGFKPSVFKILEEKIVTFLKNSINDPKAEIFIPSVVYDMIRENRATVKVLKANSPWFGVTYKDDTPRVVAKIRKLIEQGDYPEKLY
jgi:NDP-sugar pyrophosphorylase family protein